MNNNFCDCSQGRFPCTCTLKADLASSDPLRGRRVIGLPPELAAPYGDEQPDFYRKAAETAQARVSTTWVELNAIKWKLRIVETLALIGWAGLVLTQLGVL